MSSDRKHIITKCCCLQLSQHLSFSAIRAEHWTAPRLLRVPVVRLVTGLRVPMSHHRHTWPSVTRHTSHRHTHRGYLNPVHHPLSRISKSAHYSNTHLHLYFLSSPTTLKYPSHEAASRWILIGTFFSAALSPVTRTAAPSLTVLKLAASHSFFPLNTLRPGRLLFV